MKKVILVLTAPMLMTYSQPEPLQSSYDFKIIETPVEISKKTIPVISNDDFLNALIFVESRGNDSAIGDRHLVGNEAVGALQIRPIMVREVNRILKIQKSDKRYRLKDRYDREKTIEMFLTWKNFHHKNSDFETIARNWNGGPRGYKLSRTERYWNRVKNKADDLAIR